MTSHVATDSRHSSNGLHKDIGVTQNLLNKAVPNQPSNIGFPIILDLLTTKHKYLFTFKNIMLFQSTLPLLLAALLASDAQAFCPAVVGSAASTRMDATSSPDMDRRTALGSAAAALVAGGLSLPMSPAFAADLKTVVVAGATGQTGRRILERLAASKTGLNVIAGVRNVDKASKSLAESSTVIRGAMVQQIGSVDTSAVDLKHLDVVQDSVDAMAATLKGADALVIAVGFIPGNPLKLSEEAHKVDNVGTCKLIDAAKAAGVSKVVMVSSILTNGREWGQEKSPGFIVTNAFGNVLDEKIVAEKHLRASGMDYTIVRPGGLKAKPRKCFASLFACFFGARACDTTRLLFTVGTTTHSFCHHDNSSYGFFDHFRGRHLECR